MQPQSHDFKKRSSGAIEDKQLQRALGNVQKGFISKRALAAAGLPEFEALRDQAKAIKDHTLAHLDLYLERYEQKVTEAGGSVHWCATAEDARNAVSRIC